MCVCVCVCLCMCVSVSLSVFALCIGVIYGATVYTCVLGRGLGRLISREKFVILTFFLSD